MSAWHSSRLKRLRIGTSPTSATLASANGARRSTCSKGPILSMARTARGPRRAPGRLVTPRSMGTPTNATPRPPKLARLGASGRYGADKNVAAWANGQARLSPVNCISATRRNSGSKMSPPDALAYFSRSALSLAESTICLILIERRQHRRVRRPWVRETPNRRSQVADVRQIWVVLLPARGSGRRTRPS
jgi:hypothetical protein